MEVGKKGEIDWSLFAEKTSNADVLPPSSPCEQQKPSVAGLARKKQKLPSETLDSHP